MTGKLTKIYEELTNEKISNTRLYKIYVYNSMSMDV